MECKRPLPTPDEIHAMYPMSETMKVEKRKFDESVRRIFTGEDDRLLLIIGPCSADREDAVLEYLMRLRRVQEAVEDRILILPRMYTTKPRTSGDGYMGMLHQPDLSVKPDIVRGLVSTRRLHINAARQTGFYGADEILYPESYLYLGDCLSYAAVGARSVENQQHRLVASGLDIPVGMKNPTFGDLSVLVNSIKAAQHGHTFIYSGCEVVSKGNPLTHAILRGYMDRSGRNIPNCHADDLSELMALYEENGLKNPAVLIDTNHANSDKNPENQPYIAKEVLAARKKSASIARFVKGFMIESYLVDGCQEPGGAVYGQSITDGCIGWDKTEKLIFKLAEM